VDVRTAEVRRLFDRYLVELVEPYDLCPWARPARLGGEVSVEVLWGTPSVDAFTEAARALLARPTTKVAMVIAPEIDADPLDLREIRSQVTSRLSGIGVAEFHPDSPLDATTPARLVPYLRRSPDPLLQLVPLSLLASVRAPPTTADRVLQIQMLGGQAAPLRGDVADIIAADNHARVTAAADAVAAKIADIAEDRRRSYARVGITIRTGL